ncbi:DUF4262 domain-containing protein [Micromonospora yangpuensis]|uniref:DUF4262 domain-containing protein n=1 Tax=Micromonospora yangpuensis TaxID=683228 RepID=A0A1C6U3Z7_9ACTN|nr:DUF4262 domain-containing protein [Micromonospora yangpuensis]GGL92985.1 hypothetical protein GCM10012279_08370 [Micromonospora yangpuensis]SCL48795.1 protein of unknown function [Micromonospora yangpuensis]
MPSPDEILDIQRRHITETGWAVTAVLPAPGTTDSPFAYTVGLTERHLPELVIAGLDPRIAQILLNDLAGRVHTGAARLTHGHRVDDLIVGYPAVIVEGPATEALWPGTAYARYGRDRVHLQQIVWPDRHGRFPWHDGYEYPGHVQPLLGCP